MDAKTKAIVAHITLIGWVIALVVNSSKKDEYASYYIRQMLGVMILGIALSLVTMVLYFVPLIEFVPYIVIIAWIVSLIYSTSGEMKPLPVVGEYFQNWFKGI